MSAAGAGDLPGVTVRGGAAGVTAQTEHLVDFSRRLGGHGAVVAAMPVVLARIATDPALLAAGALDPAGSARVYSGFAQAGVGLGTLALRFAGLAAAVAEAAVVYRLAETEVEELLVACWRQVAEPIAAHLVAGAVTTALAWGGLRAAGEIVDETVQVTGEVVRGGDPGPAIAAALERGPGDLLETLNGDGEALLEWLVRHPTVAREALAVLAMAPPVLPADPQGVTGGAGAAGFAQLLIMAGRPLGLFVDGRVEVSKVERRAGPAPRGVGDLVGRLTRLTAPRGSLAGTEHLAGAVMVDNVTDDRGSRRWVVYLPPTHDWGATGGPLPTDLTSNVSMVAKQGMRPGGADPDAVEAALVAIRKAGVARGEPVLLVGFSQGGITAATLASDPQIRRQYKVEGVLAAGAPVSEFAIPNDVQVLTLENDSDPVPELDGTPDPDRPNWVNVNRDVLDPVVGSPVIAERVAGAEVFAGHYLDGYIDLAEQLDTSTDPSVTAWRDSMSGFLQAGKSETIEVTTRRVR